MNHWRMILNIEAIVPYHSWVKSRYIWNGHPTFNRESLQWVYKPLLLGW